MYVVPSGSRMLIPMEPMLSPWERGMVESSPFPGIPEMHMRPGVWDPPCDFVEEKDRYLIFVDCPGMRKEDIEVEYTDGILYVRGERAHEKEIGEGVALTLERRCGSFVRHFHLRSDTQAEKIRADYSDGVLRVTVPKGTRSVSKTIPINAH